MGSLGKIHVPVLLILEEFAQIVWGDGMRYQSSISYVLSGRRSAGFGIDVSRRQDEKSSGIISRMVYGLITNRGAKV